MKDVKEIIIDGENIFLKKGMDGYRVVHPWKNVDGSLNWFNILTGGKSNLIRTGVYIAIAILLYFGIDEIISSCKIIVENPDQFCRSASTITNVIPFK